MRFISQPLYTVFGNNNVQQQSMTLCIYALLLADTLSMLDAQRRQRPEEQVLARVFMLFTLLMILWLLVS